MLTIPAEGGPYGGIFGGKLCQSGVLVSGGFSILQDNVKVTDSWIGEAFAQPRVYFVRAVSFDGSAVAAGDIVRLNVTCLAQPGATATAAAAPAKGASDEMTTLVAAER